MGKISQYTRALKAKLSDLFVVASSDNGSLSTKAVTTEQIGDAVITEQTFSDLDGKTPAEAIADNTDSIGNLSSLTTTNKSSLVGAVNEAVGAKRIYINTTYQNDLNTSVTLSETIANFRYLRVTLGASSFDNWNLAYVLIPHMRDTTISGYYPFVTNGQAGKWIRLSVSLTYPTTLTVLTSSEASVGVYEVVGIY